MCSNTESKVSNETDVPEGQESVLGDKVFMCQKTSTSTIKNKVKGKQMLQHIKLY